MTTTYREVAEIDREIAEVSNRLAALKTERNEAIVSACGLRIGQRVRNEMGKLYEVCRLDGWWEGRTSVYGHPIKKDGEPSKQVQWVGVASGLTAVGDNGAT